MKWHCGHVCLLRLRQGKSIESYIHVITVIVVNEAISAEAWRLQGMSYTKRNLKKKKKTGYSMSTNWTELNHQWVCGPGGGYARRLVLKAFIGNCNRANRRYSHCFCIQNSSKKSNRSCRKYHFNRRSRNYILFRNLGQTHTKWYTLIRTERSKTIPCPAAHSRISRIGHIRENPLPRVFSIYIQCYISRIDLSYHEVRFWGYECYDIDVHKR